MSNGSSPAGADTSDAPEQVAQGGGEEDPPATLPAEPAESAQPPHSVPGRLPGRLGERLPRPLTVVAVLAVALFALWGIGNPLLGLSSLSATGTLVQSGPYPQAGFTSTQNSNLLYDTYTGELPGIIAFKSALGKGQFAGYDPTSTAGAPLGVIPNDALLSPLTIPYYVLPTWMGPAYSQLIEIIVAVGGCFLFLRRLRISRAPAVVGGLVFAASGFMISWLDFPQTRVAAFIPALFWTLERFLQTRRVRDAALIALPVAAMLLGGFPSVTGYACLTGAAYALARLIALHRAEPRRTALRRFLAEGCGVAVGFAVGIGLSAFQLLPFEAYYKSWLIIDRAQNEGAHLSLSDLLTTVAPWAYGTGDNSYILPNIVESFAYVGAAAMVLVLVAVAMPWRSRPLVPETVLVFAAVGSAFWAELVYVGGPPLGVLQKTPVLRVVFGENNIGRARSILGFLLAVLAAVGLEILLRRRQEQLDPSRSHGRARWVWPAVFGLGMVGLAALVLKHGYSDAKTFGAVSAGSLEKAMHPFERQIAIAAVLILLAAVCVALLWYIGRMDQERARTQLWRGTRFAAAAALPLLITVQGTVVASQYYPRSPVDTFYPQTDTHQFLANNLGEQRYASSSTGMVFGSTSAYGLRAVNGHAFINQNLAAMINAIPGYQITEETYIDFPAQEQIATSPILDQLGAKYFVAALTDPVFGKSVSAPTDGSTLDLEPNVPVTVPVPVAGRLRAVGLAPTGTVPAAVAADATGMVDVVIRDASGAEVAHTDKLSNSLSAGSLFDVPVAADTVAAGTKLTATITLKSAAPVTVEADHGALALAAVAGQDDGLVLTHVDDSAIYERLTAQPRIRWASSSTVVSDQGRRVSLLASGKVSANDVVLSQPGPAASGAPASVSVTEDADDTISASVDAQGAGYLVIADPDQVGWDAYVDGRQVPLVAANQGVVAVQVPQGQHMVTLRFNAPHFTLGLVASAGSVILLVLAVVGEWWWLRRRRPGQAAVSEL
jgi:Bacterial membrane protein YfhO